MKTKYFILYTIALLLFQVSFSQSKSSVGMASGSWVALMKGDIISSFKMKSIITSPIF